MNLLDFAFRLGVLFAIYGFLWGLIEIGMFLLAGGRKRTIAQAYLIKAIKYFFLVDVTFLFCLDGNNSGQFEKSQVIFAGLILLTYFVGKLQKNQNRSMFFKLAGRNLPNNKQKTFSMRMEIIVIAISLAIFVSFWFFPEFSMNPISIWFRESIINIEDTPVFGFIFKVIGFFFLLSLIFKMAGALGFVLSGGKSPRDPMDNDSDGGNSSGGIEDQFVDYEEVD